MPEPKENKEGSESKNQEDLGQLIEAVPSKEASAEKASAAETASGEIGPPGKSAGKTGGTIVSRDLVDQLLRDVSEEELAPAAGDLGEDPAPRDETEFQDENEPQHETDFQTEKATGNKTVTSDKAEAMDALDALPDLPDEGAVLSGESGEADDDNLLSQEELDRLLLDDDDEPEAASSDEEPDALDQNSMPDTGDATLPRSESDLESDLEPDIESEPGPELEQTPEEDKTSQAKEGDDDSSLISPEDIDRLLSGPGENDMSPEKDMDDDAGLVSQEDIDRLLMDGEDEGQEKGIESGDEDFSDQEEIDRLLKGIEEDGTGNEPDSDEDDAIIPQGDIDQLLQDAIEEEGASTSGTDSDSGSDPGAGKDEDLSDKVILEEADDIKSDADKEEVKESGDPRVKSRFLLIGASIAGFIVMALAGGFLYLQMKSDPAVEPVTAVDVEEQQVSAIPMPVPIADATSLNMEGFIVLAPGSSKNIVFLKADVSVEFEDQASLSGIKKHEAYFRYLIYNELKEALTLPDASKISETMLIRRITRTLQKTLPDQAIVGVAFKRFDIVSTGGTGDEEQTPDGKETQSS